MLCCVSNFKFKSLNLLAFGVSSSSADLVAAYHLGVPVDLSRGGPQVVARFQGPFHLSVKHTGLKTSKKRSNLFTKKNATFLRSMLRFKSEKTNFECIRRQRSKNHTKRTWNILLPDIDQKVERLEDSLMMVVEEFLKMLLVDLLVDIQV